MVIDMTDIIEHPDLAPYAVLVTKAGEAFCADYRYAEAIAITASRLIKKQNEVARARETRHPSTG